MLLTKPEGMCTVSSDLQAKTVTIGFLDPKYAQQFRNHLVDKVIDTTQGKKKEPLVVFQNIDTIDPVLLYKWRSAFEQHFKNLDFTMKKDAWNRDAYFHEAVQSLWDGWIAHAMYMKSIAHAELSSSIPIPQVKAEKVITACPSSM